MIPEKGNSAQILERLMSSYGVNTQKELAVALDIPANNISGWTQRDSVPGNAIIKCALDTGADLQWLMTGDLAKANFIAAPSVRKGAALYKEIMSNGGKPVLRRIMDAYGFTLQKQLCDLLNISSGTVSTWIRRNYFPGDVVVTCALDTGASLAWLATGKGSEEAFNFSENKLTKIPKKILNAGSLEDCGDWFSDLSFLSKNPIRPIFVVGSLNSWLVDTAVTSISNGRWLLTIDGKYDIYDVSLLPKRTMTVTNKLANFTCSSEDIITIGKSILTFSYDF